MIFIALVSGDSPAPVLVSKTLVPGIPKPPKAAKFNRYEFSTVQAAI